MKRNTYMNAAKEFERKNKKQNTPITANSRCE